MKLVLKDGTELEMLDGSYQGSFMFYMTDVSEIATISKKLTEDNLSSFTVNGEEYRNFVYDGGTWGRDYVSFAVHQKTEIDYVMEYMDTSNLTDEQAMNVPSFFNEWAIGVKYKIGDRCRFASNLYKCVQAHTSQTDWMPSATPALWVNIADPTEEWPEWKQPTGAHDAYKKGDKVSYNGAHWISDVDGNAWAPGVAGWSEVAVEPPSDEPTVK